MNSNVLQAIKEGYYFNNNMKEVSFKDYLESESENDPNFFFELFDNEEYEQKWDHVLSEEDREEWEDLINKADTIWQNLINDEEQEQRCRLDLFFSKLFVEKDINEAKAVIKTLPSYKEFCQNNSSDVDTDYIDEETYTEVIKGVISDYLRENNVSTNLIALGDESIYYDGNLLYNFYK